MLGDRPAAASQLPRRDVEPTDVTHCGGLKYIGKIATRPHRDFQDASGVPVQPVQDLPPHLPLSARGQGEQLEGESLEAREAVVEASELAIASTKVLR
jgi:hypothetical protein